MPDDVWILCSSVNDNATATSPSSPDALRLFQGVFGEMVRQAMDPEVRLAAIKGIRTLVSRSMTLLLAGTDHPAGASKIGHVGIPIMQEVSDTCLEITLQAWENPPTRKMASSLPSVFQAIVDWKELLAEKLDRDNTQCSDVSSLGSLYDKDCFLTPLDH